MTQIKQNALRITTESADRSWTGVAAAWASLNGTGTIALRDSQNIASVTDNGTGNYTYNLTTSMSSADYALTVGPGSSADGAHAQESTATTPTASLFRITWNRPGVGTYDRNPSIVTFHGDLA